MHMMKYWQSGIFALFFRIIAVCFLMSFPLYRILIGGLSPDALQGQVLSPFDHDPYIFNFASLQKLPCLPLLRCAVQRVD